MYVFSFVDEGRPMEMFGCSTFFFAFLIYIETYIGTYILLLIN